MRTHTNVCKCMHSYTNAHIFFENMLKTGIIYDICIFKSKKIPIHDCFLKNPIITGLLVSPVFNCDCASALSGTNCQTLIYSVS